ncbi:MFS transporter [Cellulomonas sp. PhB143]|uniref:MFS transporter n=1 Tax=Cellulomonas sp. PhB143 TaxID=2485186 RepID=UPI000F4604E3|nr:MFS transporter [Cellulomonas sp. PhB143]ROS74595.1 putative MFS family arabinose efflux permease [Cellulomonas sp. PhB143]
MSTTTRRGTDDGRARKEPGDGLGTITTDIPARMDRLPWARWHWMIVIGLGTVWVLDGLEVTIVGNLSEVLKSSDGLGLTSSQIGVAGAVYVTGSCLGALVFGQLTDRFGRKRLFIITLLTYLLGTVLTAFSMNPLYYFAMRFVTGLGIGGEYAAVNSAVDELIPARYRGRIDITINGSYWLGAAAGALVTIPLLDPALVPAGLGWRLCFGLGAALGLAVLFVRRHVPESPRWLFIHGRQEESETIVRSVEDTVARETGSELEPVETTITVKQRHTVGLARIARTVLRDYPRRTVLCLFLFVGQAFLYNAFFFTYGDTLQTFLDVDQTGAYLAAFALSNFVGALALGPLFDKVGRVRMISGTYIVSGVLLAVAGLRLDSLTALSLTAFGMVVFFFASAGASSAYLTASEVFPMETRALCIALFYAVGTAVGGITGPLLFGRLIESAESAGDIGGIAVGYYIGAGLMVAGGVVAIFLGVGAERKSLEDIATPLTAQDAQDDQDDEATQGTRGTQDDGR